MTRDIDAPQVLLSLGAGLALNADSLFQSFAPGEDYAPVRMQMPVLNYESHVCPRRLVNDLLHVNAELAALYVLFLLYKQDCVVESSGNVHNFLFLESQDHSWKSLVFSISVAKLTMVAPSKGIDMASLAKSN